MYLSQLGRAQAEDKPGAARFLDPDRNASFADSEPAKELHALYSKLREEARLARSAGNANTARISDGLAEAVLKDLEAAPGIEGPLAAARDYSRELNQTFRQGRVGNILGFEREGGVSIAPEMTLGTAIGRPGLKSALTMDEIRAAVGDNPNTEAAASDFIRRRFGEFSAPRGEFKPERAQDFLRQNAELLERFPAIRQEITQSVSTGFGARNASARMARRTERLQSMPGEAFINAPYGREFEQILKAKDPASSARSLVREAARDRTGQATRGIKSAALEHVTGSNGLNGASIMKALKDKRSSAAIREVLSPDEIGRLETVASRLDSLNRADGRLPDVGAVMNDPVNSVISFLGRTFGARMGARAGQGTSGASLLTAKFGSDRIRKMLESLTNDTAERLVRDAIEDPDLFKSLLQPVDTAAARARVETRLVEWMSANTGLAAGEREQNPPWLSDPVIGR
ncbi:MAG: hypothetical protein AAGC81_10670 [Pseudomonadota bacterium]